VCNPLKINKVSIKKKVQYLEAKKMFLADTPSRDFLPAGKESTASEFETINAVTILSVREDVVQDIRHAVSQDTSL
jgi:hypothetical protein